MTFVVGETTRSIDGWMTLTLAGASFQASVTPEASVNCAFAMLGTSSGASGFVALAGVVTVLVHS